MFAASLLEFCGFIAVVGIGRFAKFRKNRQVTDCMTDGKKWPKIPYFAVVKKMDRWSRIHTRIRIDTKN